MPQEMIDLLKAMHLLDIVLFLIIVGFAFLGFARGMVRIGIVLLSIYIGFVVAALYYAAMAGIIIDVFDLKLSRIAEIIAFLLVNIVVTALLILLLSQFFGHIEITGRAGACLDRPAGMILGFFTGIFLTVILVNVLSAPFEYFEDVRLARDQAPYIQIFNEWYEDSLLRPVLRPALEPLLASIQPLLGGRRPALLTPASFTDPGLNALLALYIE